MNNFFKRNLGKEWGNLYETIERNTETYKSLKGLPRLLPLAKELQNDKSLHCLMPWQHHGVLTLFLMDWERQTTHALVTALPTGEDVYRIYLHDENLPYSVRPLREIESMPLGEIRSLIYAELQARRIP